MSIESFVSSCQSQLRDLATKQANASGSERGQLTRKIRDIETAIKKATRKGLQE